MKYDVAIIGAGMSGLAAGIRLAYFGKQVCIFERHYAYGGLNSYYTLDGREFDVGLHAVTNYVAPGGRQKTPGVNVGTEGPRGLKARGSPLPKLLRQLRLSWDDFQLRPQGYSEIRFPGRRLRFANGVDLLVEEVADQFPQEIDGFRRLIRTIEAHDDTCVDPAPCSTRSVLRDHLRDPLLIEMILCPIMYYGSAREHDMDFTDFVVLFKSIFCEGMARPVGGVRTILKALVRKFRACGGKLRLRCGIRDIHIEDGRVTGLTLDSGETVTADVVFSSAGYFETMRLCGNGYEPRASARAESARPEGRGSLGQSARTDGLESPEAAGRVSFVESIVLLDRPPGELGHDATIVFFNDAETFTYAVPDDLVDLRSGVICCPNNYEGHEELTEGVFRVTWLANYERWTGLDDQGYTAAKAECRKKLIERGEQCIPGFADRVTYVDTFTPRTIQHFTGHINGAVYGAPGKVRDGRTPASNLFICGTDQGYLGIVGAMISGVTMANVHVLAQGA